MGPYDAMIQLRQWLLWRNVHKVEDGVTTVAKMPFHPVTGEVCDAHDPNNWVDYNTAVTAANSMGVGLAFVLTDQDNFFLLDLDKCWTEEGWSPEAMAVLNMIHGNPLVEVSQSRRGLHAIARYAVRPDHSTRNPGGFELYTSKRFIALGDMSSAVGDSGAVVDLQPLIDLYFPPRTSIEIPWRAEPVPEANPIANDEALITKFLESKSARAAFGGGASNRDLWEGNDAVLATHYPSQNERDPYDRSAADSALAARLAWWTGKNHQRVWELMHRSALRRDKWNRVDYLPMTINDAVGRVTSVYGNQELKPPPSPSISPDARQTDEARVRGMTLVGMDSMRDVFKPFAYIANRHEMLDTRTGVLYGPSQFRAIMGGLEYMISQSGSKSTDKNAFAAFTENLIYDFPKYYDVEFMPGVAPGTVIERNNLRYINNYVPYVPPMRQGDPTPALEHIKKLLPHGDDADILLTWMAAVARNPGRKVMWSPIVIGCEGNGKTTVFEWLEHIIGLHYSVRPNAQDFASKFNQYMENALFGMVEEINGDADGALVDVMKVRITSKRIEIQGKGADQETKPNHVNWAFTTNHIDGLPVTGETRRLCILATNQMTTEERDAEFPPNYFQKLHHWSEHEHGAEIFANWLMTEYQITEKYNPYGAANVAPKSTTTEMAIRSNFDLFQQHILEAIEEERVGFRGGWVSSNAITALMRENRVYDVTPRMYRKKMEALGFISHPCLPSGRLTREIANEGMNRPRIYVKRDHPAASITAPVTVADRYAKAQGYSDTTPNVFAKDNGANQ